MTRAEEFATEKKIEDSFKSQRELPFGRDYRWNSQRFISSDDRRNFRRNMDAIFPNAPGAGL